MKSFKQYLIEAEFTKADARRIQKFLKRRLNSEMEQDIEKDGDWWELQFRAHDFFTSRPGEEDDDHPDFTGWKEVEKHVKAVIPKGVEYQIQPEEKGWITIAIKSKDKPAKAAGKKKGKLLLPFGFKDISILIDAAKDESKNAPDLDFRIFFKNLVTQLKKEKKKTSSIDHSLYLRIAAKTKFYNFAVGAADELWSLI